MAIPAGELFYGQTRRRVCVVFDDALHATTRAAAGRLRALIQPGQTPPAEPGPKCRHRSLREACLPDLARRQPSASSYVGRSIASAIRDDDGPAEPPSS